jgi:nucleoside-diphosphate-sugar epimerase
MGGSRNRAGDRLVNVFAFGFGYSAARLAARGRVSVVGGTMRKASAAMAHGVDVYVFDGSPADAWLAAALKRAEVGLVSTPPESGVDPVLRGAREAVRAAGWRRIVYLSTVGVYGDAGGAYVDEDSPLAASSPRARARIDAEGAWAGFGAEIGAEIDILRLGGIYGPGRGPFEKLRSGEARAVVKPGQVFNRIHVDDIAGAVEAVIAAGRPGAVYNVVDGSPSAPEDVLDYGAQLLGLPPPPRELFETADLSPMARSFYEENRRVRNDRLRALGWAPEFPTYREGLSAMAKLNN